MPNNTNRADQTNPARWLHVWTDEERRNKKAQSANGLGKACRREGSGHEEDHLGSGLGLAASLAEACWKRVLRVWVQIRAQLVWGEPVLEKIGNGENHICRRHLIRVWAIQPLVHVRLAYLGPWNTRTNAPRQLRLPTSQIDRHLE